MILGQILTLNIISLSKSKPPVPCSKPGFVRPASHPTTQASSLGPGREELLLFAEKGRPQEEELWSSLWTC